MINGIGRVLIFAKNITEMTEFYRDALGLDVLPSEQPAEDWVEFDCGGACKLALHSIPAPWRDGVDVIQLAES